MTLEELKQDGNEKIQTRNCADSVIIPLRV